MLEFALEEEDKADFLKEFPLLNAAPDTFTVHSTYDRKWTVELTLAYVPANYSTVSAMVSSTINALRTLEGTTQSEPAE